MPPRKKKNASQNNNNNKSSSASSMETSPAKQAKMDASSRSEAEATGVNDSHGSGYQTPNEEHGGTDHANDTIIDPPETDEDLGPQDDDLTGKTNTNNYILTPSFYSTFSTTCLLYTSPSPRD